LTSLTSRSGLVVSFKITGWGIMKWYTSVCWEFKSGLSPDQLQ